MPDFNAIEAEFKKLKKIISDTVTFFKRSVNGQFAKTKRVPTESVKGFKVFQTARKTSLTRIATFAKGIPQLNNFEKEIEVMLSRISYEDNDIQLLSTPNLTTEQITYRLQNLESLLIEDQKNTKEAGYLLDLVRYLKFFDINEFFIKDATISAAPCTLYQHKSAAPQKGVLIVPGFSEVRQNYQGMALILAKQGYRVIVTDLPSQGTNASKGAFYSLGLAAEWISGITRYFRASGIQRVGVVGHSFGAYSILFAAGGYSLDAERNLFIYYDRYQRTAKEMISFYEKLQNSKRDFTRQEVDTISQNAVKFEAELELAYNNLMGTIEISIRRQQTMTQGRIDVIVALAPPMTVQYAIKDMATMLKLMKFRAIPSRIVGGVTNILDRIALSDRNIDPKSGAWMKKMDTEFMAHAVAIPQSPVKIGPIAIYDKKAFAEYLLKMKDPHDYFSLMHYFSQTDKVLGRLPSELIASFVRNHFQRIPKLFIYGAKDHFLRGLSGDQIEGVYMMCGNAEQKKGNTEIKRYEDRGHALAKGRSDKIDMMTVVGTSGDTTNDIASFLNHHL